MERCSAPARNGPGTRCQSGPLPMIVPPRTTTRAAGTTRVRTASTREAAQAPTTTAIAMKTKVEARSPISPAAAENRAAWRAGNATATSRGR